MGTQTEAMLRPPLAWESLSRLPVGNEEREPEAGRGGVSALSDLEADRSGQAVHLRALAAALPVLFLDLPQGVQGVAIWPITSGAKLAIPGRSEALKTILRAIPGCQDGGCWDRLPPPQAGYLLSSTGPQLPGIGLGGGGDVKTGLS